MAAPTVLHDGFLIPNAQDVARPVMAEPDRIDFNTVAHGRYGVIEGCKITVSGSTATTVGGIAVVNGKLTVVPVGSADLGVGDTQDLFVNVVVNNQGALLAKRGTASTDPVFPDTDVDQTLLASVFCPAGESNYSNNVIDKRRMMPLSLLTKVNAGDPLIVNRNGAGNLFAATGQGDLTWSGDTVLKRSAAKTLQVTENLVVDKAITAGEGITAKSLTTTERITGSNLINDTALPGTAEQGAIFQNRTNGKLYVRQGGSWQEIATVASAVPVATIITSLAPPDVMGPLGWYAFNGQTVTEGQAPTLFPPNLTTLAAYITGTTPNRVLTLPNLNRRLFMVDFTDPGRFGGNTANNTVTLNLAQMPVHKHNARTSDTLASSYQARTDLKGAHKHGIIPGGTHIHGVNDPQHQHGGADFFGNPLWFIVTFFDGYNKIDAYFNDRSHTYSVEKALWTSLAATGISINEGGSSHGHDMDEQGSHDHLVNVSIPQHGHVTTDDNMGGTTPVDITPAYFTVYSYIRG